MAKNPTKDKYSSIPRTGLRYPKVIHTPPGTQSYYDPHEETIYAAAGENPSVMQHEMFHHWQNLNRGLQVGPVRDVPITAKNPGEYYNRRQADIQDASNKFLKKNPSFVNIPFNLLYNKEVEPSMYYYPEYAEGEAEEYENYVQRGGQSIFPEYAKGGPVYNWIPPNYPRVGARNEQGGWLEKYANGGTIEDQKIPTPTTPSYYPDYPDRTLTNYQMGTPKAPMYAAGSTVWTKQTTPTWVAGTPTPTATQNFRNDRSLNTDRYRIGDVVPTGMDYKSPAAGTYDYSKDIQPYHTMRLHAPTTTKMARNGGAITNKYKKRVGIPYAINPGISDAGMYVGPTTQRGITFADGGDVPPYITSDPKEFAERKQAYNDSLNLYNYSILQAKNYFNEPNPNKYSRYNKREAVERMNSDRSIYNSLSNSSSDIYGNKVSDLQKRTNYLPIGQRYLGEGSNYIFEKPVQKVIFNPEIAKMPMRGIPPLNVNVKADVKGRPTYRNWNTGELMYDIPEHLKIGSNWRSPEKKADGGDIPPFYVSNPNDPRLKSYNDSLDLFKSYGTAMNKLKKDLKAEGRSLKHIDIIPFKTSPYVDDYKDDKILPIGFSRDTEAVDFPEYIWSTPIYKKPVQPIIYQPKPDTPTPDTSTRPTYSKVPLMPMRGMPSTSIKEAVPQKVTVPKTKLLPPQYMDTRGEWSSTPQVPPGYTPEQLLKMGYRAPQKKANGGWLDSYEEGGEVDLNKPYLNPATVQSVLAKANQPVTTTTGRVISTPASREKERREKVIAKNPSKYSIEDYKQGIKEPGLENGILQDPIALAAALTAGEVTLGAIALSQVPRMFLGNLASEATAGLTDVGKYLTRNTALKNAYKINPFALNLEKKLANENVMIRGLGEEGLKDALNSKLLKSPDLNDPNIYWTDKFNVANNYAGYEGNKTFATYPKTEPVFSDRYAGDMSAMNEWIQKSSYLPTDKANFYKQHWLKGYKEVNTPTQLPGSPNAQQAGFIDLKGAFQKYPKGPLTQEEIIAYKNSPQYKQVTEEHSNLVNKYGDSWQLPNYMEDALQQSIATGNRRRVNPTLYGGRNWGATDYIIAGLAGTAYPGYLGITGLAFSPPAVKNKVLNSAGITSTPGVLSSKDTTINITNRPMDFAKVNETADGQVIIGGEFIEGNNNTVRKAKDWLTATDTYSDKEYSSKDIQSFYGIENGKFKVGKASEFKPNTEIVPRRFGATNISQAILNEGAMRLLDKEGNPIYQNTPNTGKFILYSPSTKESEFNYINTGKSGVDKINKFLKKNKDAQYIHLDNGRYEFYGLNPEGLSGQDFRDYYQQDLEREGNPGYNMIIKKNGGMITSPAAIGVGALQQSNQKKNGGWLDNL